MRSSLSVLALAVAAATVPVISGCGAYSSTGVVIPPGGRASLQIDTAGGRMDLKNKGPGTVTASGTQEIGNLPRADLGAGSSVTWPLQGNTTIELRNTSDRQAEVHITAQRAHGIAVQQPPAARP
jgi:hypothetical protein